MCEERRRGRKSTVGHVQIDSLCSHLSASLSVEIWGWANGYDEWLATTLASLSLSLSLSLLVCRFVSFRSIDFLRLSARRVSVFVSIRTRPANCCSKRDVCTRALSGGNVEGLTGDSAVVFRRLRSSTKLARARRAHTLLMTRSRHVHYIHVGGCICVQLDLLGLRDT